MHTEEVTDITVRQGLGHYFAQHALAIKRNYWQIVQIAQTDTPGYFTAWVFTDDHNMQKVTVRVPRVIYVNTREPDVAGLRNGKPVERLLPRGRKAINLYEVRMLAATPQSAGYSTVTDIHTRQISMEETRYLRYSKQLADFLTHSQVEGVYETQVLAAQRIELSLLA